MTSVLNQMPLTRLVAGGYKSVTITYMSWLLQNDHQPIHLAASKGHLSILQLLIDVYGISPTAKTKVHICVCTYLNCHNSTITRKFMECIALATSICICKSLCVILPFYFIIVFLISMKTQHQHRYIGDVRNVY